MARFLTQATGRMELPFTKMEGNCGRNLFGGEKNQEFTLDVLN